MRRLPRVQRAILEVVEDRERVHAYEIKRILMGVVGHASVYAALTACQGKGYLTAEWSIPGATGSEGGGPPRKYFELTEDGRRALTDAREESPSQAAGRGGRAAGG